ncbi:MAG TPA: MraY family glycosyltransferase [Vicinamibacterales bacterium]|nr:MraY family glycosyltransferase [Vicinamibacterales bacterium]
MSVSPSALVVIVQPMLIAFALAVALVPLCRVLSIRLDVVARPRADRWHRSVVPLLGGVAIGLSMVITGLISGLATSLPAILFASIAVFITGLVDDILLLRPASKLVSQIAIAAALVYFGFRLHWVESRLIDSALTMVWVVGLTNAFNLLDNMDGLCAGIALIVAVMLLAGFWTGVTRESAAPEMTFLAILAGAAAGFLVFNFPPASIFMGDSGALLFGFALAALTLGQEGVRASRSDVLSVIAGPAFVLLIPIFDTTLVTVARLLSGRSPARGGRDHSSHRLVAIGLSERDAVLVLWGLASIGGMIGLLLRNFSAAWSMPVGGLFLLGMGVFAVYLVRVRVYDDVPAAAPASFTLLQTNYVNKRRVVEVIVDVSLIFASYYWATSIVFNDPEAYLRNADVFYQSLPVIMATQLIAFFALGMYRGLWRAFVAADTMRIVEAIAIGTLLAQVILFVYYGTFPISWLVVTIQAMMLAAAVVASRLIGRAFPPD